MNDYDTITTTFQDDPDGCSRFAHRETLNRFRGPVLKDLAMFPHHSGGCSKDPRRKLQSCIKTSQVS